MKFYRVIKLDKHGKTARADAEAACKDAPDVSTNVVEIRHKVKVVKPRKTMRKFWTFWL